MRPRSNITVLATAVLANGCGSDGGNRQPLQIEVSAVVTSERVEVHVHQPGGCREATAMPATNACETFGWALIGVQSSSVTDLCTPEPTCVTEIRLERGGEVVGASAGPSVGFFTSVAGGDARIVLSGCGEPMIVALPAPLAGDVAFEATANPNAIHVAAKGPSVASVFARAESLITYPRGYLSSCRSESGPVDLPTSKDSDGYVVTSFALGTPVVAVNGSVRVFPGRAQAAVLSESASLGAVWDAAVLLAKQSSLYATCHDYCSQWSAQCGSGVDPTDCAVSCVAAGEAVPTCSSAWETLTKCLEAAPACNHVLIANYSENPQARSQKATGSPCAAEEATYESCVGAQ